MVAAAGGLPGDLHKTWRAAGPRSYHMEYGYSTMGYEVAGGLGVAMAEPERRIYVMLGDGSYLMLSTELDHGRSGRYLDDGRAARQPRLPLHPRSVGGLRWRQSLQRLPPARPRGRHAHGRASAHRLAANAASLGASASAATWPAELEAGVGQDARQSNAARVAIVVEVNPEPAVPDYDSWWDVPIAEVSESARVRAARTGIRAEPGARSGRSADELERSGRRHQVAAACVLGRLREDRRRHSSMAPTVMLDQMASGRLRRDGTRSAGVLRAMPARMRRTAR